MTKQTINVGATANDKKGDSLRAAFQKVNANFTELYVALGLDSDGLNLGAFEFSGSTMSTTDSSGITIDQATTISSNLTVGGDILPSTANGGDLGSSSNPWRSLYVSNNTIFIGGTALGIDSNGALTAGGTVVGGTPTWASVTGKPTFATVATSGVYGDLSGRPTIPTLTSQLANDSGFITAASIPTDFKGSVFADDSTLLVDAVSGSIPYSVLSGAPTIPTLTSQLANDSGFITAASIPTDFKGSVFADDSTLMIDAVDNKIYATELTVAVGNFVNVNSNNVDVENINGLASQINFTVGGYNNLVIENNLVTIQNVSLSVAGDITLGGAIRSEGNINIDINLTDSTLRRWQFGEDGILTLPSSAEAATLEENSGLLAKGRNVTLTATGLGFNGVVNIKSNSGANTWTFGNTGNLTIPGSIYLPGNIGIEEDNGSLLTAAPNHIIVSAGTDGTGSVSIKTNNETNEWTFAANGTLTFPDSSVQTTAFTGTANIARNIESENDVSIKVNLTDSTQRIWSFGEDGELRIPGNIVHRGSPGLTIGSSYNVYIVGDQGDNNRTWTFDGTSGDTELPNGTVIADDGDDGIEIVMPTTNGLPNSFKWKFSDVISGVNDTITLEYNLLGTNLSEWYFAVNNNATAKYLYLDGATQSLTMLTGALTNNGKLIFGTAAGNNAGDANAIELKATDGDVYLTSTESVKITVDANDSSARVWRFDPTGELAFPDGTSQSTAYQTSIVRAQRASGGISTTPDKWTFTTVTGSVTGEWVVDGAAAYPALGLGSNPYIIFTLTGFTKLPETFYRLGITGASPGLTNDSSAAQNMTNATSPNILTAFNPALHKYAFSEGSVLVTDIYWEFRM